MKTKFNEFLHSKKMKLASIGTLSALAFIPASFAAEGDFNLSTTMTTAVTKIVGDLMSMIAAVLPITITLLGASIGITYGIKFIKKIMGKA